MCGLSVGGGDLAPNGLPRCPDCGEVLSRSQPDPNQPERLLGICDECGAWYQVSAGGAVARLVTSEGAS